MADPVTATDTLAGLLGNKALYMAEFILKYQIMHIVVGAATAIYTTRAARRSLERGRESKYRTPCNGTNYTSLGEAFKNPATGNELVLQDIRKEEPTIDIRTIFDASYRSEVVK